MKIIDCEQYSDEWWQLRCGLPTASCADRIFTPGGKVSATSVHYIDRLCAERAGLQSPESYKSEWMDRGHELEPEALAAYRLMTGETVQPVGFILSDDENSGCSPDGAVIEDDTLVMGVEIKCPKPSTMLRWQRDGGLPPEHKPQVHLSMVISDTRAWDFFAYCPGTRHLPVTVLWDKYTDKLAEEFEDFLSRLEKAWQETLEQTS